MYVISLLQTMSYLPKGAGRLVLFWGAQRKKWLLYTGGIEEKSILLNNNVPKKEHTPMRLLIRIKKVGSKGILHFCF